MLIVASGLRAQDANLLAEEEAVKRQEATIRLHQKVNEAADAEKKHRVVDASKLYQEAVALIPSAVVNDPRANADKAAASDGLVRMRVELSNRARKNGDLLEAQKQLDAAVRIQPQNPNLVRMKMELDVVVQESRGTRPSDDVLKKIPEEQQKKIDIATRVQNGKLLYEMGRLKEAEAELKEAIRQEPGNKAAYYYLDLIKEGTYRHGASAREEYEKSRVLSVEDSWLPSHKNEGLQVPNPMARTNLVYTTKGRQNIFSKLEQIHLNEVSYDLPLSEVLKTLRDESRKRDPDQKGINFLINPHSDAGIGAVSGPDPNAPPGTTPTAPVAAPTTVDLSQVTIKISPPLNDVTLSDVLDAITKVADVPIKFTIEDYAVVFSPRPPEAVALYSKQFHVDPNTFIQGLEGVRLLDLSQFGQGGGGGKGGGRGGGSGGQQSSPTVEIPSVSIAPISQGRQGGGGGAQAGQNVGLSFVTKTNNTQTLHEMVRAYFTAAGVTLTDPGKSVFFNDRTGLLLVRASLQDLEIIEAAVEMLNQAPPQLTIESKFAEMTQSDSKALGFDWFLGNTTLSSGRIGLQGGTAPSFQGNGTTANPSGIFPGGGVPVGDGTFIPGAGSVGTSAADQLLTAGLRQTYGNNNTIPTVGTITGILTDPQFRVAIRAIEQRSGADLLSAPKVTTLSGRQAHISVLDLVQIVTGVDLSQTAGGAGAANNNSTASVGVVASSITFTTDQLPFGPSLDVMPTVSADGYSIQMVMIPTFTEFLGYDNPGQFVPQAQSVGGSTVGIPLTAVLPLPRLRVRQVVTTCNVWDGQTVVLGGLISEDIRKIKDKVPILGDLPFFGRLFRSESNESNKKNLLVFVTPTIIDPAGNRLHTDEEMPFARTSIPAQPAPANQ
ncbi:MAG: Type and secretion system protein [Verrucomicrobiales bacterium]|nr:Type and secretion system protein [Verrucomicrobiales bacterium]